ncbi:MAG: prolyl oligopeptidase family serine peptidase [Alphaproteobacteria bacterium]|nr:prolyl oligopeptidase family serine peptidase [Alphaproteobacteria bacterium]
MVGRQTLEERIAALLPGLDIVRPEGNGPFPVVIQLHGCGGKKPMQTRWAGAARLAGWAALIIDSYRHRRISSLEAYATVCTGARLWGRERAGDLYAALEWVRRQSWADRNRIVVAGWSHGGWTALDAMCMSPGREVMETTGLSGLPCEPLAGLVGAFLVYPFAGPGSLARTRGLRVDVSPMALVGTRDVIVGGRSLGRALERMPTPGQAMQVVVLEGATHAFDEPEARDLRTRHDLEITARAQRMYRDYLGQAEKRSWIVNAS